MGPKNKLETDLRYMSIWGDVANYGILGDLARIADPALGDKLKDLGVKMREAMTEDYVALDIQRPGESAYLPYDGNSKLKQSLPTVEGFDHAMEILSSFKHSLDDVVESPNMEKYPAIKGFMSFYSQLAQRALDGRDISSEMLQTPGAFWLSNIPVDFVSEKNGKKNTPEDVDRMLSDLHFEDMGKHVIDHMDALNNLSDPTMTQEQKEEYSRNLADAAKGIEQVADHMGSDETVEKVSDLYQDAQMNLKGSRGVVSNAGKVATREASALQRGWDPQYVQDISLMSEIVKSAKKANDAYDAIGDPALSAMRDKANVLASFDPETKTFDSKQDFVDYYQSFSNAVKDVIAESQKPGIQDKLDGLRNEVIKDKDGRDLSGNVFQIFAGATEELAMRSGMHDKFTFFAKHGDFQAQGITADKLKKPIDHGYILDAVRNISPGFSPVLDLMAPLLKDEPQMANLFSEKKMEENIPIQTGAHLDPAGKHGPSLKNPYTGSTQLLANSGEQQKQTAADLEKLSADYEQFLGNDKVKELKGMRRFMEYSKSFIDSAKEGYDKYSIMSRIPGGSVSLGFADWRDKAKGTNEPFTAEQFDDMITGMQFDKMWDNLDRRCELERSMEGKHLSAEQKADYGEEIRRLNEERIAIHEHQMSDASAEAYSKFYQNFDDTVRGARGYNREIKALREQNEALENGWDPTRISDFSRMKEIASACRESAEFLKEHKDPAFADFEKSVKRMAQLDPDGRHFENQAEFDAYSMQFSKALSNVLATSADPKIQKSFDELSRKNNISGSAISEVVKRDTPGKREIYEYFANRTDLTKQNYKDAPERMFEVKRANNHADVNNYKDGLEDIREQAREKLKHFTQNLDGLRKENSEQYTNMRSALENVANLKEGESLENVNAALDNLAKTSQDYTRKNKGWFKRSAGQQRLDAAADLTSFAAQAKSDIGKLTKGTVVERHAGENLDKFASNAARSTGKNDYFSAASEKAAGIDAELNQKIQDALEPHVSSSKTKKLDAFTQKLQKRIDLKMKDEYNNYDREAFEFDIAQMIVVQSFRDRIKKDQTAPVEMIDYYARLLPKDPAFQKMMKDSQAAGRDSELAQMEPGELFAKMSLTKQNMKMQKAAEAKQKAPQRTAQLQDQQPKPQPQRVQGPR